MFRLDWMRVRGATRGTPRPDRTGRRRWPVMMLIASLALLESGCQSGPFSQCGSGCSGLFSPCGFFGRVSNRVFNRSNRAASADCCGTETVSSTPVEYGAPSAVVVPPAAPSYQSAPATLATSTVPSAPPDTPSDLDAIPRYKIGPPPASGTSGASGGTPKASYYNRRSTPGSAIARYRNDNVNVARNSVSTPEPTSRSARAPSALSRPESDRLVSNDPLDNLPPLDLPGEVTQKRITPPIAPAAGDKTESSKPSDVAPSRAVSSPAAAPSTKEGDPTTATLPAPESSPAASVGPGMTKFLVVDLNLAGVPPPPRQGCNGWSTRATGLC